MKFVVKAFNDIFPFSRASVADVYDIVAHCILGPRAQTVREKLRINVQNCISISIFAHLNETERQSKRFSPMKNFFLRDQTLRRR